MTKKPDPDKMWIKKPSKPSPDAEKWEPSLWKLPGMKEALSKITDEDIERMTYDYDDILDDDI